MTNKAPITWETPSWARCPLLGRHSTICKTVSKTVLT